MGRTEPPDHPRHSHAQLATIHKRASSSKLKCVLRGSSNNFHSLLHNHHNRKTVLKSTRQQRSSLSMLTPSTVNGSSSALLGLLSGEQPQQNFQHQPQPRRESIDAPPKKPHHRLSLPRGSGCDDTAPQPPQRQSSTGNHQHVFTQTAMEAAQAALMMETERYGDTQQQQQQSVLSASSTNHHNSHSNSYNNALLYHSTLARQQNASWDDDTSTSNNNYNLFSAPLRRQQQQQQQQQQTNNFARRLLRGGPSPLASSQPPSSPAQPASVSAQLCALAATIQIHSSANLAASNFWNVMGLPRQTTATATANIHKKTQNASPPQQREKSPRPAPHRFSHATTADSTEDATETDDEEEEEEDIEEDSDAEDEEASTWPVAVTDATNLQRQQPPSPPALEAVTPSSQATTTTTNSTTAPTATEVSMKHPPPSAGFWDRPALPTTIQIRPGVWKQLCGAQETWTSIYQRDFYLPIACATCETELSCIRDVGYVLCPVCHALTSTAAAAAKTTTTPRQTKRSKHQHPKDDARTMKDDTGYSQEQNRADYDTNHNAGDDDEEEDIRQEDMVGVGFTVDDLRIWELRERNNQHFQHQQQQLLLQATLSRNGAAL